MHIRHPRVPARSHLAQGRRVQTPDRTETCQLNFQPWSCQGKSHVLSNLTSFSEVCILHPDSHQQSTPGGALEGNACLYSVHMPPPACSSGVAKLLWGAQHGRERAPCTTPSQLPQSGIHNTLLTATTGSAPRSPDSRIMLSGATERPQNLSLHPAQTHPL